MWRPTRRDVLAAGAALALGGCGGRAARFGDLQVGIQSWSFRAFPLAQALELTAALGLPRIELTWYTGHLPFPAPLEAVDDVRRELAAAGINCLTTHIEPAGVDAAQLRAVFAHTARLGARTNMMDALPPVRDALEAAAEAAGVRIGIHNHTASAYTRLTHVQAAIADRPTFGAIIDTGHFAREGEDPVAAIYALAGRIVGVHLKDVVAANPAAPDAILGRGVVDVVGVVRALHEVKLPADVTVSIEYEESPEAPYADLAEGVAYLEGAVSAVRS
jgi:sugar phosphate isomerase/epimerase